MVAVCCRRCLDFGSLNTIRLSLYFVGGYEGFVLDPRIEGMWVADAVVFAYRSREIVKVDGD